LKSSSGNYYIGLDHVRAFAAFTVFTWHFIHAGNGHYAPPPVFPLSLLSEGHTGVALFITLSGYLFAKLLDGKNIHYASFIWNRLLRLVPLLVLVILIAGYQRYLLDGNLLKYAMKIFAGAVMPSLPNGGWSITAEFHFYLLLPFLLFLSKKSKYSLIIFLIATVIIRGLLHQVLGQIQTLSYHTIIGRIDQFLLGIIAYQFRSHFDGKHLLIFIILFLFATFWWYFDLCGGFYKSPSYPSHSAMWIYIPTVEGIAYASTIAWYDNSFKHSAGIISRFFALIGTYSYSIYLLHFFIVFKLSGAINSHLVDLSNIYVAIILSPLCYLLMLPIGYLSYRFVESPFLKLRTRYIIEEVTSATQLVSTHEVYLKTNSIINSSSFVSKPMRQ
jgi:peptidoglycan/LPS O-acetylase OafA/YrhL